MLKQGVRTVSSFCSADKPQCVEVTYTPDAIEVRDTKLGDRSPVVEFTEAEWRALLAQAATLDGAAPRIGELQFTIDEWSAFVRGIQAGEFAIPDDVEEVKTVRAEAPCEALV